MKTRFCRALAAAVGLACCFTSALAAPPTNGGYQHFHFKEQRFHALDRSQIAIELPANVQLAQVADSLTKLGLDVGNATQSPIRGWFTVPTMAGSDTPAAIEAIVQTLANDPAIAFASPVFSGDEGMPYWPSRFLVVEFSADAGAVSRQNTLSKVNAKGADFRWAIMPNAARVELNTKSGFEALESSNALAVANETTFAECDNITTGKHNLIPNDTFFGDLWGIHNTGQAGGTADQDMDGPEAWDITTGSNAVITIIMDVGVQQAHPDLNSGPGNDFTGNGSGGEPINACDNHGTAVASCISGRINNAIGITGIAPATRTSSTNIGVSSLACNGSWSGFLSWSADAINWGVSIGARVSNNSNSYGGTSAAVETAYLNSFNNNNMVHFASAGNSGAGSIAYPSSIPIVNSVAALHRSGNRATFSQFGPGLDFSAPGQTIYACDRTGANGYVAGDYVVIDGTSFASPYAAGVAALVTSRNPALTSAQVETIMRNTAVDLGAAGYDTGFGWGFVNANNAVIAALSAPSNNSCGSAIFVGIGTVNGTTLGASADGTASCGSSNTSPDVWYYFRPNCNGTYRFSTCNTGTNYDTVLSVHTTCPGTAANQVSPTACNDDVSCTQFRASTVDVALTAGTFYWVRVSGFNGLSGNFALSIAPVTTDPAPGNDVCAAATAIGLGTINGSNFCAGTDGSASCGFQTANDVWYSFTPGCTGAYTFSTCGGTTNFDTVLSLHTGCPGSTANQITCNDDACGLSSSITATLTAGTNYRIRVAGYFGAVGTFTLNSSYVGPQANDLCANAIAIAAGSSASGSTVCANNDGSANCAASAASPDVWYSFTADCSGWYVADCQGSGYDTALSIHSGCPGNTSNQVACNDDFFGLISRVVWYQPAGATYLIRMNGFASLSGNYVLNVGNLPNNDCGNFIFVPGNGSFGYSNRGATTDGTADGLCIDVANNQQVNQDVWFLYQASCTGTVTANTCDSTGYDSKMAAYAYQACPPVNPLACNDDAGGACPVNGLRSQVSFPVTQGSYYFIRVGGYQAGQGCGVLNLSCTNAGCYGSCVSDFDDGSGTGTPDGGTTIDDLLYYLFIFEAGDLCSDVDDGSFTNTLDGGVTIDDLLYYLFRFEQGC